jgi:ATP-binding cassette, subfamily C, bacterial CydD
VRALDKRLLRRTRAARTALIADAVLGVVAALLALLQAVLIAHVAARGFEGASLSEVAAPLTLLLVAAAGRAGTIWGFEVVGRRAATEVISQLRLDVVERRLTDQPAALDGADSAEVATAAVSGVDALETTFARFLPQLVLAVVMPLTVLAAAFAIDPVTALLMLLTLPLVPVFMWLVGRYTAHRARERWQALAVLSTHFLDVVRGLPTLRAFNRGQAQTGQIAAVGDAYRRTTMGTLRIAFLSGAVLELAATLGIALVAVTVGVRLVNGGIELAPALTVLLLAPELYLPLRNLAAQFHASADGLAVTDRLLDLAEAPTAIAAGSGAPPTPRDAAVRFESVSFAYPSRDVPVLDGVDLELAPGESVALVGESGAGKSTIASLVLRLADPTAGRLLVGTTDLSTCDASLWRRHLAWVPQQPTLVRGTVAENIRLGSPDATDDDVTTAATLAGADAFVRALPHAYETIVGEGGRTLSVGERRRIALARAFARSAPLVILDEPTADLDPQAASDVVAAIERLSQERTVLLIAHRPELAAIADRVVRLERGRIVDEAVPAA